MKLQEAIKGMAVESWEARERSMPGGKTLHGESKTLHDRRQNAPWGKQNAT
jgi:hypothetical protein